ncbi:2,3-bisphosphoglycerate-independent phosphoglycerate mutase [Peptoniphilus harei]|uniref:2,3-bisphosphoglycerate-independent phosphoglycerate mutase n=1 Tax=Peptoniphilus harei TaxID=54005 RepID=A0A2X1WZB9_9FIRM|nr:hypothetical protein [Peptoniphilus harei]SPY36199.1 2,3-bisphosphoglycerate-independent phosphoglycerate mutase [Peptoniphilus harei]
MKPTMLIILDGFGINESEVGNAVKLAKTPTLDELYKTSAHTKFMPRRICWASSWTNGEL